MKIISSRPAGGANLLKQLWERLNLTVDLIFFDTTNTYFEINKPGPPELKAYGKSKHKRDDLPQITIGLAVTREGIPIRCWVLPGNQHDGHYVEQMQKNLHNWNLGRVNREQLLGRLSCKLEALNKKIQPRHNASCCSINPWGVMSKN